MSSNYPKLFYVRMPDVTSVDSNFTIFVSFKMLLQMKDRNIFGIRNELETCLSQIGYQLTDAGVERFAEQVRLRSCRVGKDYAMRARNHCAKKEILTKWWQYSLCPNEIELIPLKTVERKNEEARHLRESLDKLENRREEEKENACSQLRKSFSSVTAKQQQRQLSDIRYVSFRI